MDDIQEEVDFWKSSIVCYALGANPPLSILEGFVRRMWNDKIDKVGMLSYGVFLIRFISIADRDEVLKGGYVFFNKRSVVMKAWDPAINLKKEDIRRVPIWVHLDDLDLKYWGEKSLFKIIGQVGTPLMVDEVTKFRDKLSFPRVLIEVSLKQDFPDIIYFEDENGFNTSVSVTYEWKPIVCNHCSGLGHSTAECRKKGGRKQEWVIKDNGKKKDTAESSKATKLDDDGFQPVTKGWKPKDQVPAMTAMDNPFQALA
ncbi:uncharacterized protein LOC133785726 [Humulus lupulus]|uniref:uncharacterized protein LOC133785726 n=1 Tax=Humulus lupulus TaxID=3486 RepID=UPI002B401533|nr:uncharacterized protein LOC133785726 [Humulus lupulus]